MAEEKEIKETKAKKLADSVAVTIEPASQQMIERAHDLGIETAFDRAVTLKPCNIGTQGICCKNCGMGPCRLPLPKGGFAGEDTRKGICGATPNTIAARNVEKDLLSIISVHPMREDAVSDFLTKADKDWSIVSKLISKSEIVETKYKGQKFYMRNLQRHLVDFTA